MATLVFDSSTQSTDFQLYDNNDERHLFVFDDVVYNLQTKQFEKNVDDHDFDHVYKFSGCGYNYRQATDEERQTLSDILTKIFPNEKNKQKFLEACSTGLDGWLHGDLFIFHGDGGNCKSMMIELLQHTLGKYSDKVSQVIFGNKYGPELYKCKNSRMVIECNGWNEYDKVFSVEEMANYLNLEEINIQELFRGKTKYYPQFNTIVETCFPFRFDNPLGSVGLKKRVTYVEFKEHPKFDMRYDLDLLKHAFFELLCFALNSYSSRTYEFEEYHEHKKIYDELDLLGKVDVLVHGVMDAEKNMFDAEHTDMTSDRAVLTNDIHMVLNKYLVDIYTQINDMILISNQFKSDDQVQMCLQLLFFIGRNYIDSEKYLSAKEDRRHNNVWPFNQVVSLDDTKKILAQLRSTFSYGDAISIEFKKFVDMIESDKYKTDVKKYYKKCYNDNNVDTESNMSAISDTTEQKNSKSFESLGSRLKGKQGHIRGNLTSPSHVSSSRTVITSDPNTILEQYSKHIHDTDTDTKGMYKS